MQGSPDHDVVFHLPSFAGDGAYTLHSTDVIICGSLQVGFSALAAAAIAAFKLLRAVRSCTDNCTASAPSLPPAAFAGKVVWITGASSGIGAEMAMQLARLGGTLILSARRKEVLEQLQQQVEALGAECRVLPLDLELLDTLAGDSSTPLSAPIVLFQTKQLPPFKCSVVSISWCADPDEQHVDRQFR